MKTGSILTVLLLTIVALAHLLRLIFAVEVLVDSWQVPQWVSIIGFVVPALLAQALVRERARKE